MSSVETKVLEFKIINLGTYRVEMLRINAPLSIQHLMNALPLRGRSVKQGSRLIMPTDLKVRPEKPRQSFDAGDISLDPSSGNLSIHLEASEIAGEENFLGSITEEIVTKGMPLSSGIIIKEISSS